MRFLHTADWHIGKGLRGRSRMDEHEAALNEVLDIATREKIDCLLMAGDVFDSQVPRAEAENLVYRFLAELAGRRIRAVVIAGNHDHPARWAALKPLLEPLGVHVRHFLCAAGEGGVIGMAAGGEEAMIAVMPFVPEHKLFDAELMMGRQEQRASEYAEAIAGYFDALCCGFSSRTVNLLMAHLFVNDCETCGSERAVHIAKPYAVQAQRFPATAGYVALGHLHKPQEVASPVAAHYAGSLLQLDFGEQGQAKRVVLVDAKPGKAPRIDSIRLSSGRSLRDVSGTRNEIEKRAGELNNGDLLRVTLKLDKLVPGVADQVRQMLPDAVDIRVELPKKEGAEPRATMENLSPRELFARYHREDQDGAEAPEDLLAAFDELYEEELRASGSA